MIHSRDARQRLTEWGSLQRNGVWFTSSVCWKSGPAYVEVNLAELSELLVPCSLCLRGRKSDGRMRAEPVTADSIGKLCGVVEIAAVSVASNRPQERLCVFADRTNRCPGFGADEFGFLALNSVDQSPESLVQQRAVSWHG